MKKYLLEIIVFICGAAVMILELLAARVLSPYVGSSNLVWTSIIGIILLSMSLGYSLGGKLADKSPNKKILANVILISAVLISLIPILETIVIRGISGAIGNLTLAAILSAIFVFALPSLLLAMVSPYAIKLKEVTGDNVGKIAGNLSAFSTLGSIFGTFLAGFYLIPSFGNRLIILGLTIVLVMLAIFIGAVKSIDYWGKITVVLVLVFSFWYSGDIVFKTAFPNILADIDSEYSRIWVCKLNSGEDEYKGLIVDKALESYIDKNGKMASKYLEFYDLFENYNPKGKETLLIGGAAYTYPMHYLEKFKDKNIDIVEIDPRMTELAKEHFGLTDNERMNIFHEDGRSYINKCKKQYDAILIDAFKGHNVPFELTTKEVLTKAKEMLSEDGMVIANVISSQEGKDAYFIQDEYATYANVFPVVKLFEVIPEDNKEERQNLILIGFKSDLIQNYMEEKYKDYLKNEIVEIKNIGDILTDDYAPVEKYL